jgi:hypothetical protein
MLLQEIEQYVEDAGLDACAEDFLEKIPWVIYPDEWTEEHRAYINKKIQEVLETGKATPEYAEPEERELRPHKFKPGEWNIDECKQLISVMKEFQDDFGIVEWTLEDMRRFLQLKHWLYPRANYRKHHVRTVNTIIQNDWACESVKSPEPTLRSIVAELIDDSGVRGVCPIHPECVHKETCKADRLLCRLYFYEAVSWIDLVDRVKGYKEPLETKADVEPFLIANPDLFKTRVAYDWLCAHIYWAKEGKQ